LNLDIVDGKRLGWILGLGTGLEAGVALEAAVAGPAGGYSVASHIFVLQFPLFHCLIVKGYGNDLQWQSSIVEMDCPGKLREKFWFFGRGCQKYPGRKIRHPTPLFRAKQSYFIFLPPFFCHRFHFA
jgi:hypothetical protein